MGTTVTEIVDVIDIFDEINDIKGTYQNCKRYI